MDRLTRELYGGTLMMVSVPFLCVPDYRAVGVMLFVVGFILFLSS